MLSLSLKRPAPTPPEDHDPGVGADDDEDMQEQEQSQGKTARKRARPTRSNAPKACEDCRKRRVKCDGAPNDEGRQCSHCRTQRIPCEWSTTRDRRRAISKQAYEQQEVLIRQLEETSSLQTHQINYLQTVLKKYNIHVHLPRDLTSAARFPSDYEGSSDEEWSGDDDDDMDDHDLRRLRQGFGGLMLRSSLTEAFAPGVQPTQPRTPYIQGFSHSTSRVNHVRPLHFPTGNEEEASKQWFIYLPRRRGPDNQENGPPLLTRKQHDDVLRKCLLYATCFTLRIIPHLFLRDLARMTESPDPKPRVHHYSPMLHNFLIATALAFSDDPYLRSRSFRDKFINEGKRRLDAELENPTLSTVQSLALLSTYCSSVGEQTSGWMYFGMASYIAHAIGLHVQLPPSRVGNDEYIERSWVYWSISTHHKLWELFVGRNQSLPLDASGGMKFPPPTDFRLDNEPLQWTSPDGRNFQTKALLSSSFAAEVKLMNLAPGIMKAIFDENFRARATSKKKVEEVTRLWRALREWRQDLAPELRIEDPGKAILGPHVWMVNLAAEWLTLLLLESFYQSEQLQRSQRQPPLPDTASPPYAAGASQSQDPSQSPPNVRSSKFHHNRQDSGSNHTPEYLQKQRDREDLFRRLCSLANTECVSRANHALALVAGYDKLFGLRNTNVTMVQIIYQVGETLLRGVVSGLRTGAGERAMAAGAKAREKVHECIKWLKIVGETYKSGTDSARNLELALEQTIKDGEQKRAQEEKRKKAVAEAKRRVAEKNANDALDDFDFEGMEHNNEDVERVLEAIQSSQGSSQPSEPVPPLFAPPPGPPPHWADTNPIVADPTIGLPSDAELMALLQNSSYEDTSPIGTFMTASGTQDLFASWLANAGLSASLTAGTAMSAKGIPTLPASISMAHAQGQTSTSPPPLSTTPALRIKGPAVHARPMEYPPQRPNPISSLLDLAVAEAASDSDYRTGGGGDYGSQLNVPGNGTGYLSDTGYISAGGVAPAGVLPSADRQVSISPTSPTTMTSAMSMAAKAIPIPMPSGKSNLPVRRGRSSLSNLSPIVPTTSNATAASMGARYQPYGQKNRATANLHHPRGVAALRADSVFRVDDSDGGLSTGFTDG